MEKITAKERCTGCMLCTEVCPYGAVHRNHQAENGYYYPVIDRNKCVDCGICRCKCPQCAEGAKENVSQAFLVYLAWAKDTQIRKSSSSGGVFTVLAESFLEAGGVVIGAAFDKDYRVTHIAVEKTEDLWRLRLSKYVQSDTTAIWAKVRRYVEENRLVLFTGVPCQIDALKNYYDDMPENLYTVDLICRGVPSPVLWQDYLQRMRQKWGGEQISYINYRHKGEFGWTQRKVAIGFRDGKTYMSTRKDDLFAKLFFNNIAMRESCFECRYSDTKRTGDLTLGDFWAFRDSKIEGKEQGLSMAVCSNKKGRKLLDSVKNKLYIERIQDIDIGLNNSGLGKKIIKPSDYDTFWENYEMSGFTYAVNQYLERQDDDRSDAIYRRMAFLMAHGIHIYDILGFMGIDTIYISGTGEMERLLKSDLRGKIKILNASGHAMAEDGVPIIISNPKGSADMIDSLCDRGIGKKRIITLNVLLYYGMFYWEELSGKKPQGRFPRKEFLVTGAQFRNKGSQSMLFTAVSEIRDRVGEAIIWFCPNFGVEEYEKVSEEYQMIFLLDGMKEGSTLYEVMPRVDKVIDVSGYALTSLESVNKTDRLINFLRLAKKFETPMSLMPQSAGPFDYNETKKQNIKKMLSYANIIFAREQSGYHLLANTYGLTNVEQSMDMVLQNKGVNPQHLFKQNRKSNLIQIPPDENVALIPNIQNYKNGRPKVVLKLYQEMARQLLKQGKNVYIIAHSDDETVCSEIYESFQENEKVHLYTEDFDCLEFSEILSSFKYMIASRYHAIIHGYKKYIPCIVVGWAEKYTELLMHFGQEPYLLDVRQPIDLEKAAEMVKRMDGRYAEESVKIAGVMKEIQKENCFDLLSL